MTCLHELQICLPLSYCLSDWEVLNGEISTQATTVSEFAIFHWYYIYIHESHDVFYIADPNRMQNACYIRNFVTALLTIEHGVSMAQ